MNDQLTPNALAFIALTNEYCHTLEHIGDLQQLTLAQTMLKLLPRIYITAGDLAMAKRDVEDEGYISPSLDENTYDQLRLLIANIMGEDDVYLETMVEDMRYSDSPVSATVSENLADLYQEFFNFVHSVQDMPTEVQYGLIEACVANFREYWGQTLCNVLRALHNLYFAI